MQALVERHCTEGFAFFPHQCPAVDGDIAYGDPSMRFDWLKRAYPADRILGTDRSLNDPYQIDVFIRNGPADQ